jgi:FAD/FMN-containing dehydrogenase
VPCVRCRHFFIGSEGTLGIITEATLRLQNIPEQTAVAVCSFPSVHDAAGAAIAVVGHSAPHTTVLTLLVSSSRRLLDRCVGR